MKNACVRYTTVHFSAAAQMWPQKQKQFSMTWKMIIGIHIFQCQRRRGVRVLILSNFEIDLCKTVNTCWISLIDSSTCSTHNSSCSTCSSSSESEGNERDEEQGVDIPRNPIPMQEISVHRDPNGHAEEMKASSTPSSSSPTLHPQDRRDAEIILSRSLNRPGSAENPSTSGSGLTVVRLGDV